MQDIKTGKCQTGRDRLSNRVAIWLDSCLNIARHLGSQPCLLCGASTRSGLLCAGCADDLPRLSDARCPCCALPTAQGEFCGGCLRHPPAFDRAEAVFRYAYPLDGLVHALKFRDELPVARFFARHLAERLRAAGMDAGRIDRIVPMPLHPRRLRERGFNQAGEIARHLARLLGIPVAYGALIRARDAAPQAGLPLKSRIKNLRGAFSAAEDLSGLRVALVDDVMTSGASMHELAKVARAAGAKEVSAWIVARTLPGAWQ